MRAVLERDFVSQVGRGRAVVLRTVVGAVVATVVLLALREGLDAASFSPDAVGSTVFLAGSIALLSMIAVLAPPAVVGAILQERQEETLPLVLAAPVGPRAFALAKLLARTGVVLTWGLATVPCLVLPVLFGGVSGERVAEVGALALGVALETAAWALWISSRSRRFATAVILSYLLPFGRWIGTMVAAGSLHQWVFSRGGAPGPLWLAASSTPFPGLLDLLGFGASLPGEDAVRAWGAGGAFLVAHAGLPFLLVAAAGAALAVLLAGERLRRESEPTGGFTARTAARRRWFRRPPGTGNPLAWKETRLLNAAGSRPLYYSVLAGMLLTLVLSLPDIADGDTLAIALAVEGSALALVAVVNGAAAFSHEKASGAFDLLRITLLSPTEFLRGKAAGVLRGLGFLAVVPAAHLVLFGLAGRMRWGTLLAGAGAVAVVALSWAALGIRCGVAAPTVRGAVVRATATFGGILLLCPVLAIVAMLVFDAPEDVGLALVAASPPVTIGMAVDLVEGTIGSGRWPELLLDEEAWSLAWLAASAAFLIAEALALPRAVAARLERERDSG